MADICGGPLDFPVFGTRAEALGTCAEVFGTRAEVLGTRAEVFGTRAEVFGARAEVLGMRGKRLKSNPLLADTRFDSNRAPESTHP